MTCRVRLWTQQLHSRTHVVVAKLSVHGSSPSVAEYLEVPIRDVASEQAVGARDDCRRSRQKIVLDVECGCVRRIRRHGEGTAGAERQREERSSRHGVG